MDAEQERRPPRPKLRILWRNYLQRTGYTPPPEVADIIKDLYSQSRIDTIIKTSVAQARGFIQYAEGTTPGAFAAFPAQEFRRVEARKAQRRDWPVRWRKAGGRFYGERMIALKDDPVWVNLSVFGNPFPPFDWGSGMGVRDIARDEAEKLGLITREDLQKKVETLRKKPAPDFNENLQATVQGTASNLEKLQRHFGYQFGDLVRLEDGVLKWRPEVLRETVLQKNDFSISLGMPQPGMLHKLLHGQGTADFAYEIAGKELSVDQTWRDTKRSKGGTHLRHFIPTAGDKKKYPDDIPLRPEDLEMLPCLWRNPDRVIKLGKDKFLAELDAFNGSTYMMQVKLELTGPKLWTFLKTKNPTSKKIVAGMVNSHLGPVPSKKEHLPVA